VCLCVSRAFARYVLLIAAYVAGGWDMGTMSAMCTLIVVFSRRTLIRNK